MCVLSFLLVLIFCFYIILFEKHILQCYIFDVKSLELSQTVFKVQKQHLFGCITNKI